MLPIRIRRILPLLLTSLVLGGVAARGVAQGIGGGIEVIDEASRMLDKRGAVVSRDLEFTDSRGYPLKLSQFFPGDRPVLLNLAYYSCPHLCSEVMTAMTTALQEVDLRLGEDYAVLTISIDPKEKPPLAAAKKASYVELLGKPDAEAGWTFAVGDEATIQALADTVGFQFRWSEMTQQYAHSAALMFLSPQGKVTTYLQGMTYDAEAVRLALVDASEGKLGTVWDEVKLNCLTFDPTKGSFTITAMTIMKIGGALTVIFLAVVIFFAVRRDKRRPGKPRADEALSPSS